MPLNVDGHSLQLSSAQVLVGVGLRNAWKEPKNPPLYSAEDIGISVQRRSRRKLEHLLTSMKGYLTSQNQVAPLPPHDNRVIHYSPPEITKTQEKSKQEVKRSTSLALKQFLTRLWM